MSTAIGGALAMGLTMKQVLAKLNGLAVAGKPIAVSSEARCAPYLHSTVVGWVDGPPSSNVAFVMSGADGESWRRWTISKVGPWRYEIGCFPTPYHNAKDPLSPGVPPTASRR